jgi:hypothetical protein
MAMNNEVKIISLLEQISARQDLAETMLKAQAGTLELLAADVAGLKQGITRLEAWQTRTDEWIARTDEWKAQTDETLRVLIAKQQKTEEWQKTADESFDTIIVSVGSLITRVDKLERKQTADKQMDGLYWLRKAKIDKDEVINAK